MPMLDTMKKILPAEVRKAAAARTLTVKISSGTVDRDNDVINPRGWRFAQYLANPVVLWSHDKSIPAIARTLSVRVVGDAVLAECEFPPEGIHELADLVYDLATMGFIHSASVGFLPYISTPTRKILPAAQIMPSTDSHSSARVVTISK